METTPNEIVCSFENEKELLAELWAAGGTSRLGDAIDTLVWEGSDDWLDNFQLSLRDGKGDPIAFPVRVVSNTAFEPVYGRLPPTA